MKLKIGNVEIGTGCKPFIIAEMSGNHNQSLDAALNIVEAAAKSGAHAIKLQTYTAETITLDTMRMNLLLVMEIYCGRVRVYTNFIIVHIHNGIGIIQLCREQKNLE